MSGYPRVIWTRGVQVTVTSAADEAFWRGGDTVSAPDTFVVDATQPPPVIKAPTPTPTPAAPAVRKPVAAKGTKKK